MTKKHRTPQISSTDLRSIIQSINPRVTGLEVISLASLKTSDVHAMAAELNESIAMCFSFFGPSPTATEDRKKLERILSAVDTIKRCFVQYNGSIPFLYCWDQVHSHPSSKNPASAEDLRALFGGNVTDKNLRILQAHQTPVPSCDAISAVRGALDGLGLIRHLAAFELKELDKRNLSRKLYDSNEIRRRILIVRIASAYFKFAKCAPRATREGEWCAFLAAILSHIDGRELTAEGSYKAWLATTKWLRELKFEYPWLSSVQKVKSGSKKKSDVGPDFCH